MRDRPLLYEGRLWRSVDAYVLVRFLGTIPPTQFVTHKILFIPPFTPGVLRAAERACALEALCARAVACGAYTDTLLRPSLVEHPQRDLLKYAYAAASLLQLCQHPRLQRVLVERKGPRGRRFFPRLHRLIRKCSMRWTRRQCRQEALKALALVDHLLETPEAGGTCALFSETAPIPFDVAQDCSPMSFASGPTERGAQVGRGTGRASRVAREKK